MDDGSIFMIVVLVILVLLSAFFSSSETAYSSLNLIRLRSRADAIMEQWIAEMGDEIEWVLCNNDDMALGAADALKRKNSTAAVFGIDGTPAGLEALEQKVLWATVDCGAKEQGKAVFGIASALGMGKELPEDMELSDGRYVRVPVQARIHESIF